MKEEFIRTALIYGENAIKKLNKSRVAVFGAGGVGGYVIEALARSGVGQIDIVDHDKVSVSNINRQIYALNSTVGMYKVDVAEMRIKDINPDIIVRTYKKFYLPENSDEFNFTEYDYVVDAIDTVSGKIELAVNAKKADIPIISSMGAGNKTNPCAFEVTDIYKTSVCPLARVMRYELKKRGIDKMKVVYSKEKALSPDDDVLAMCEDANSRKQTPGSTAFVPSVAGLIIAGEVINDLIKDVSV